MDTVTWVNIGLGVFWGSMFVYLVIERRKIQFMRMMINEDFRMLTYRIHKLRGVWVNMSRALALYDKYEVSPEDKKHLTQLYAMVIEVMEGEEYGN